MKRKKDRPDDADGEKGGDLKRKDYEKELERLHVELVKLQRWVVHKGLKVCVVFEGRDGAGKGGAIKAITERVSPRVFRVVALPAPTEREKKPDVYATLHAAFPRGGRNRDLRSQLVQPGGSRTRDGVFRRRAGTKIPENHAAGREGNGRFRVR